ncbi:MAG: hypothetical protein LUE21_11980 [Oscillospiraceae bacterium]|nr:hypothetical protein [Oscillospiraceae bacterium]
MNKLTYYIRVLSGMRLKRFLPILDRAHELSGKSRWWLAMDMIRCARKYGAGYHDYIQFGMYDLTEEQKATMVTRVVSRELMDQLNDSTQSYVLDDKGEFAKRYGKFMKRDILDLSAAGAEETDEFLQKHPRMFCKPRDGSSGHGCFIYALEPDMGRTAFLARMREKGVGICEEILQQHRSQAEFNPSSLNCLRIVTLIDSEGAPHVIYAVQKFGTKDVCVDNYGPGGIGCRVDVDTGVVLWPAVLGEGYMRQTYTVHPTSGKKLLGYQVPFFREACRMCLEAAVVTPALRYVGWDVGITPDGPAIVEGNDFTDYLFYQHVPQTPDGIGMLPVFQKYAPEFRR